MARSWMLLQLAGRVDDGKTGPEKESAGVIKKVHEALGMVSYTGCRSARQAL